MNKLFSVYTLVILIINFAYSNHIIKIASDNNDTYYRLAESIDRIMSENSMKFRIEPIKTEGSVNNIDLLLHQKVDFGIVQNDVAFFINTMNKQLQGDKLKSVIPLFKEPIFILTRFSSVDNINMLEHKRIAIGTQKSGIRLSAKIILKSAGLWKKVRKYQIGTTQALDRIMKKDIDVIFVNNLTDEMENLIKEQKLFIIPMEKSFIKNLQSTFPYFKTYKHTVNNTVFSTVSIYSFLITYNNYNEKIVEEMVDILVSHYKELEFPEKFHLSQDEIFTVKSALPWHKGTLNFIKKHKLLHTYASTFDKYTIYLIISILLISIIVLYFLIILLYRLDIWNGTKLGVVNQFYSYTLKHKYIFVVSLVLIGYIVSILFTKYFEHQWALEHNQANPFDQTSFTESMFWLFVFNSTGFNAGFFPISQVGKFIISLIPMLGYGGMLALVGFITSDHIKKYLSEAKGMAQVKFKDHLIICGWNEKVPLLIQNLTHENLVEKQKIVILTSLLEENPIEEYRMDKRYVKFVAGKGTDRQALELANLKEADSVIIVSNPKSSDPDARALLIALTVEKFCAELYANKIRKKEIYTIVELKHKSNFQIAKDANVNEVIAIGDIETKLFAQSIQTPGILTFIEEIFSYNELNDIYTILVDEMCKLKGMTYDEILLKLRKYNILLLSINLENHRSEEELNVLKDQYGLQRTVITNPIGTAEKEYRIQKGDSLIVLARDEKELLEARRSIQLLK